VEPVTVVAGIAKDAWQRGRRAHPGIQLDEVTFSCHLAQVVRDRGQSPEVICSLVVEDLFLACATAEQTPGAVTAFLASYGETIRTAIARSVPEADVAEVEQRLMSRLLVGTAETGPRLKTYAGESPLDRWLRVTAKREALAWLRANRPGRTAGEVQPPPFLDPEIQHLRDRYLGDFERALEEAVERLEETDRMLLRFHFVEGLSLEKIGRMFGFSQATASRRLADAREVLLADVKATLKRRLGASTNEIASLARLVASHLDLGLSQLLDAD
jgi:RNA polymerase sigma-70 factor, ECF subfamily